MHIGSYGKCGSRQPKLESAAPFGDTLITSSPEVALNISTELDNSFPKPRPSSQSGAVTMGGSLGGGGTLEDATMSAVLGEWTFSGGNSSSSPNGMPPESLMAINRTASVESASVSLTR